MPIHILPLDNFIKRKEKRKPKTPGLLDPPHLTVITPHKMNILRPYNTPIHSYVI